MTTTATTIEVCVDCLHLLANGECPDDTDTELHALKMAAVWGDAEITLGALDEDDDGDGPEPFFSWSPCDGCHSQLGGDRELATAWT